MKILTISGSSRATSTNKALLQALHTLEDTVEFEHTELPSQLPLYQATLNVNPLPEAVVAWREQVKSADAVIIATPEYIHNVPAILKSALEWLTTSGELVKKPVFPIVYTPNDPRGKQAMDSLLWSLEALDARVVASLLIHQSDITTVEGKIFGDNEVIQMLKEGINLLKK